MSKTLGGRIKLFRTREDISRDELATRLDISIHTLIKYEQGQREPNIDILRKLSDELNVNTTTLLAEDTFDSEILTRAISICVFDLQYGDKGNVLKKLGEYTGEYEQILNFYNGSLENLSNKCIIKLLDFIYSNSKKDFEDIYINLVITCIYNLNEELVKHCNQLKSNLIKEIDTNKEEALGHLYDFIDSYAAKNGKEFILSEDYMDEIFEFITDIQCLLDNKIYKIEQKIESKNIPIKNKIQIHDFNSKNK